jgi:hypothetical protein
MVEPTLEEVLDGPTVRLDMERLNLTDTTLAWPTRSFDLSQSESSQISGSYLRRLENRRGTPAWYRLRPSPAPTRRSAATTPSQSTLAAGGVYAKIELGGYMLIG